MNIRERTMAVYRGEEPDRIPWLIYESLCPRGYMARQLRNKGLGLKVASSVCKEEMPHVSIEEKKFGAFTEITYHTPLGDLTMKKRTDLPEGVGNSWITEYLAKNIYF